MQYLIQWRSLFLTNTKYPCLENVYLQTKRRLIEDTCSGLLSRVVEAGLESQMLLHVILLRTIAHIKDASFSDPVFDWPKAYT